jgi:MFS family permease
VTLKSRGLILGDPGFRRLWIGESASQLGSQVSLLAVPLTAVVTLHAGTVQVGLLTAAEYAAFLLLGLPAGAWVDRRRRRPVMVGGNLARAALLASVPVAAGLHVLSLPQLYAVAFATGVGTLLFEVAYHSYLPSLVGRAKLIEGNSRLEASRSTAHAIGPAVAGYLVGLLTAPVALLVDATSFVWSAYWIGLIRQREPEPAPEEQRELGREITAGLSLVFGNPIIRALALYGASSVFFLALGRAVGVVFLARTLHLSAIAIGVLNSVSGIGAVLGALLAGPLARRFGQRLTIVAVPVLSNGFLLLLPLAGPGARLLWYVLGTAVTSCAIVTFNVAAVAFRQALCPDRLLGRLTATLRFLTWGMFPAGALVGGILGGLIGPRRTLWLGAAGFLLSVLWLVRSDDRSGPARPARRSDPERSPLPQRPAQVPGQVAPVDHGDRVD